MAGEHPVDALYALLDAFETYPANVVRMRAYLRGTEFFPGASGLWNAVRGQPMPPFPVGGVMVLGHNFDSEASYERNLARLAAGEQPSLGPTWRNMRTLFGRAGLSMDRCFFTNAYIGLKPGAKPMGRFPGASDPTFVRWCQRFLLEQIRLQQPRLLLTLGVEVLPFMAPMAPQLAQAWMGVRSFATLDRRNAALVAQAEFIGAPADLAPPTVAALTHPALWGPNVARRRYHDRAGVDHTSADAEEALLRDALALSVLEP